MDTTTTMGTTTTTTTTDSAPKDTTTTASAAAMDTTSAAPSSASTAANQPTQPTRKTFVMYIHNASGSRSGLELRPLMKVRIYDDDDELVGEVVQRLCTYLFGEDAVPVFSLCVPGRLLLPHETVPRDQRVFLIANCFVNEATGGGEWASMVEKARKAVDTAQAQARLGAAIRKVSQACPQLDLDVATSKVTTTAFSVSATSTNGRVFHVVMNEVDSSYSFIAGPTSGTMR